MPSAAPLRKRKARSTPRRTNFDTTLGRAVLQAAAVIGFFAAWEIGVRAGWISAFLVGSPLGIFTLAYKMLATGELLSDMAAAGADVIGVDWRLPLAEASRRVGVGYAVQGNLDPALLGAPWPVLAELVRDVVRSGAAAPGHVFNLGHGVPPDTDPDVLARIVDLVHDEGLQLRAEARAEGLVG